MFWAGRHIGTAATIDILCALVYKAGAIVLNHVARPNCILSLSQTPVSIQMFLSITLAFSIILAFIFWQSHSSVRR